MSAPALLLCDVIGCARQGVWVRSLPDGDTECLCHLCWSRLRLNDPVIAFSFNRNHFKERHARRERTEAAHVEEPVLT